MRNTTRLLLVLGLSALSPVAMAQSTSEQLLQLRQEVSVLQGEVNSLIAVQKAERGSQSALADLVNRSQRMEAEIRDLRGELESKTHALEQQQKATQERLNSVAAAVATVAPVSSAPTASVASVAQTTNTSSALASALGGASESSVPGLGQADYQRAFDLLRAGKYGSAVTALQEFIRKYPQSSLVVNAYYWLGQAQYVLGQNDAAIKSLTTVETQYAQSSLAPEAMLRLAEVYQSTGQSAKARGVLNKILKQYPSTPSAQKAQAQLQAMSR
ncbi:MAG: tol-pal system protein YbgF [Acidithiobacillus sp.]